MLRAFRGTRHTSPKSSLTKEKRLSRQTSKHELLLAETDLTIVIPKARGLDPRPSPAAYPLHSTVPDLAVQLLSQPSHFSGPTTARSGVICLSCQFGHVRKKRWRLADKQPHVCQELQSAHRNALRLGRSNDRTNREAWIQERTWFGHDQSLVEELVLHFQIRKCHRHSGHRIDGSQWRRITRYIRPGLEVHGLGRSDADQDAQDFRASRPQCQRGVEAVATLFNSWKMESRRIRDRL
jgi:hypothetical protein